MRNLFYLLLFLALPMSGQESVTATETGRFYTAADRYVGFDAFGFQYLIKDNAFIKTNGKSRAEFKRIALGKITRADIQNPLLIVLFYEDYNTAVLIDNQLNEVREIRFNDLPTPVMAHAVGLASQNRLWVFDSLTRQLMLFDYLKNTLTPIATPFKESIRAYQTDFNHFHWVDEKAHWYASDIFGKVTALGKVPEFDTVQFISGESLLFAKNDRLFFHHVKKGMTQTIGILENSPKNFYYQGQILAIFTSSGITNYKTILP